MLEAAPDERTTGKTTSPALLLTLLPGGWYLPRPSPLPEAVLGTDGTEWRPTDEPALTAADLFDIELLARGHAAPPAAVDSASSPTIERLQAAGLISSRSNDVPSASGPVATAPVVERPTRTRPADALLSIGSPIVCRVTPGGFELLERDGTSRLVLDAARLWVLCELRLTTAPAAAFDRQHETLGAHGRALDRPGFDELIDRFWTTGVVSAPADIEVYGAAQTGALTWKHTSQLDKRIDEHAKVRAEQRGRRALRPAVVPVSQAQRVGEVGTGMVYPSLALGLIMSYAQAHDGGRLSELYDFEPRWMFRRRKIRRLLDAHGPSIFLISNYVWSFADNMDISALIKEMSPESVTVHGGPSTPKYEDDVRHFLGKHQHVDICVRGEGEATTAALLDALGGRIAGRGGDLSELVDVAGLAFRHRGDVVRTPDRDRIAELDAIPSPYLNGLFDDYAGIAEMALIETNRGCPYGCTFCDWGSATLSRVRHFDPDRVRRELEWVARNHVSVVYLSDANFGMYKRDVEVAEYVAGLKQEFGYPQGFHASYAKNTAKHLAPIVKVLVDAGIMTEGNLALQTNDPETLRTVRRKNIPLTEFVSVGTTFRQAHLPITTDLLMGLPGATPATFADDLQFCIDNSVLARIGRLELLVNSPMNDPGYLEEHDIEAPIDPVDQERTTRSMVVETSSYSRAELGTMLRWRDLYIVGENAGLLRHAMAWCHQRTGIREIELYRRLDDDARAEPEQWPLLAWMASHLLDVAAPPLSWGAFYAELGRWLTTHAGAQPGSELDTVLAVQLTLAPERGRVMPETVSLAHDYPAWFGAVLQARTRHGTAWIAETPMLGTYPPASFTVDDPNHVNAGWHGRLLSAEGANGLWELESPVSRAQLAPFLEVADAAVLMADEDPRIAQPVVLRRQ